MSNNDVKNFGNANFDFANITFIQDNISIEVVAGLGAGSIIPEFD